MPPVGSPVCSPEVLGAKVHMCRRLSITGHATSTIISHQFVWCRRGRSRSSGLVWCRRGRSNFLDSMYKCIRACPGNVNVCSPEIPIIVYQVLGNDRVWPGGVRSWKVSRRRVQAPLHQYSMVRSHMARSQSLLS